MGDLFSLLSWFLEPCWFSFLDVLNDVLFLFISTFWVKRALLSLWFYQLLKNNETQTKLLLRENSSLTKLILVTTSPPYYALQDRDRSRWKYIHTIFFFTSQNDRSLFGLFSEENFPQIHHTRITYHILKSILRVQLNEIMNYNSHEACEFHSHQFRTFNVHQQTKRIKLIQNVFRNLKMNENKFIDCLIDCYVNVNMHLFKMNIWMDTKPLQIKNWLMSTLLKGLHDSIYRKRALSLTFFMFFSFS